MRAAELNKTHTHHTYTLYSHTYNTYTHTQAAADPSTEITMPKLMAPKESVYQMHVGDETKTEQNTFERAQQIETKHELEMKLTGPQALFQTELMEEMEATQRDIKRLQENISGAKTEQEKAAFATQLVDRQRQLDQIRADFETSNSDFEKGLQAEAARKSELLKKRRAAAKVCEGGEGGWLIDNRLGR